MSYFTELDLQYFATRAEEEQAAARDAIHPAAARAHEKLARSYRALSRMPRASGIRGSRPSAPRGLS